MASCNLGGRLGLGDEKGKEKWGVDGVVVGVQTDQIKCWTTTSIVCHRSIPKADINFA